MTTRGQRLRGGFLSWMTTLWATLVVLGGLTSSCGGGSGAKVAPTPRCVRASDCAGALICTQGYCVAACMESKDCSSGQRCIITDVGNSCQAPEKTTCIYTSECTTPLVCGSDLQCRNQCQTDVDCPKNQKCTSVSQLCADPTQDKNYDPILNDFKSAVDAGAAGGAGGGGVGAGGAGGTKKDGGADAGVTSDAAVDQAASDGNPTAGDAAVSLDGPAVVVDGVVAAPTAVPQGLQTGITITISRAEGGLAAAGAFELGDLTVRSQDVTDTVLVLRVSVPHAAVLGKKTLRFAIPSGVVTATDVIEVTAITAGPLGVDTNIGSTLAPFRTLKRSIQAASVGDTIHLMDGTYDSKGGEDWKNYTLPENITIVGDSAAMTVIDGSGAVTNVTGLQSPAKMKVANVTLSHFYNAIDITKPSSVIALENVKLASNQSYAVYVESAAAGSTLTFSGAESVIEAPGTYGIYIYTDNATINVSDGLFQAGSAVIYAHSTAGGCKINVNNATLKQLATSGTNVILISGNASAMTGSVAVLNKVAIVGGVTMSDPKGSLTVSGNSTITEMYADYGIQFSGTSLSVSDTTIALMTTSYAAILFSSTGGTMSLKNATLTGGSYNIQQTGAGSSTKLRGTKLSGPSYYNYYITGGDLDLGTAEEPGDNQMMSPQTQYCMYVGRPAGGAGSGKAITSSTSSYNNKTPAAAESVNALSGAVTVAGYWYIATGNQLTFY